MNRFLPIICTFIMLLSISTTTIAQTRDWSNSSGKFKIQAELVKVDDKNITLKRADNGKVITVAINKLSKADQNYLASMKGSGSSSKSGSSKKNTAANDAKVTAKAVWSTPKFVDGKQELTCKSN